MNKEELQTLGLSEEQAEKVLTEMDNLQKAHKAEMQQLKLDNAIDNALSAAGARNNKAVRALLDLSGVQLGEDGQLSGWQEQLEALQKSDGYLFAKTQPGGNMCGFQPAAGSGGVPQGQVDTRKMSYDELCAYMQQNPGAELK